MGGEKKMNSLTPTYSSIFNTKIIPVVKIDKAQNAVPLANAILKGNINSIEVTFRSDCAAQCIKLISQNCPQMNVGAGTVTSILKAKQAIKAGAKFIVTPGLNPKIVKFCQKKKIPIFPGVITPTEIELAMSLGLNTLKLFPAENFGGVKLLDSYKGPYADIKFIPTGGIKLENLNDYLSRKNVSAVGGTWLATSELTENCHWETITENCRNATSSSRT